MREFGKAREFAKTAHAGVFRRFTGEEYWHHPARVARAVYRAGGSAAAVEAAYLHDVLEDTDVTALTVLSEFGPTVLSYVEALTTPPLSFGNRATRKAKTRMLLMAAPNEVKTIKLADIVDNLPSLKTHDPRYFKVWRGDKLALLPSLKGGDPGLYAAVATMLE